jgi:hypothetical protein
LEPPTYSNLTNGAGVQPTGSIESVRLSADFIIITVCV